MPRVIAAPGLRVPHESNPRKHITDAEPVDVPDTAYYRRRLAGRELRVYVEAEPLEVQVPLPPIVTDAATETETTKSTRRKSA